MSLSASERKLRKEIYRIIREDDIVEDADQAPDVRFALALILQCSADTERAARVAQVSEEECRRFVANLRSLRLIHHDRLDFSELLDPEISAMHELVYVILVSMACAGEIVSTQPCRECDAQCSRDGYTKAGSQRWKCSAGCGSFVYLGNDLERMRAAPEELRKALKLARKGWRAEAIAQQSGLSPGQAEKVMKIQAENPGIEVSSVDVWYTGGTGKTATKWRPKAASLHRALGKSQR